MNTQAHRPVPIALTALVALFSALAALAVSNGHGAHAHAHSADKAPAPRRLWEDHIAWTRLAIISLTTGSPDTDAAVSRLLRNQTEIDDAVKPFYGRAAGNALTRELRRHILIAPDLVGAAKAGDQAAVADAQERWRRNGDDIATLLNRVNPQLDQALGRLLGPAEPEVGCDACFEELDRYVELELAGADADAAMLGLRAHLQGCPACREEHETLRALVRGEQTP